MSEDHSFRKTKNARWHGRIPITSALVLSIGFLMLITVGGVLAIGAWTARKNTVSLLGQSAHQSVSNASNKVETHLKPAEFQAKFIANWIAREEINPDNQQEFGKILIAALAAAPQIEAILFIDTNLQSFGAGRLDGNVGINTFDYSSDPYIIAAMKKVSARAGWGPPIWRQRFNKTYLNYAYPVRVRGKFIGAMVAAVSIKELSRFVGKSGLIRDGQGFLLYGREHVLAHWALENGYADRTANEPLPRLSRFSDPVLSAIWNTQNRYSLNIPLSQGTEGHVLEIFNDQHVFVYQRLKGFGAQPIIVGVHYRSADVSEEIKRVVFSLVAGLLALSASLIIVVYVGRRITRPIIHFSTVANRVQNLEIAKVGFLPNSIFRELNDQSKAFNSMLQALYWFEIYVPKNIVESLIKRNIRVGDDISEEQEITVMFTDIVNFSSTSEDMTAREVATFVNEHFTLVTECIEAEEGVLDKFIGDSAMAFWGAPVIHPDSASRACRAALAMRIKIHEDNLVRISQGKDPVQIRIGIHTGTAIIGNIGSPGRLNYTIIGDTVNIAQRLEQGAGKVYPASTEVAILISDNTANLLDGVFKTETVGQLTLKGHAHQIKTFKLL